MTTLTQKSIDALAKIKSKDKPSATYPWGLMSYRSEQTATIHGWYKREKDAKNVAVHVLFLDNPIIARISTRRELAALRGVMR